ncbi:MAG: carbohydrate kinase family protein [Candidatus Neomarinimicrobiota bacterium]
MTEKRLDAVIAGHICLDMFPEFHDKEMTSFKELFVPGKLINVRGMKISTGGPVSNTGIAMHVLGARVSLIAKIGDDFIGEAILNFLQKRISVEGIKINKGESSSYTVVIAPKSLDRIFLHNPGTNDTFCYDDIDFDLVKRAGLFHLGYPPLMKRMYQDGGEQLEKIFRKVSELGVITSLDFALPDPEEPSGKVDWNGILKRVLPYVNIFLPSIEEVLFMLDREKFLSLREKAKGKELLQYFISNDLTRVSNILVDYGANIVGLKCGSRGFYIQTTHKEKMKKMVGINLDNWAQRQLWAPTYRVDKFASAAGAGDSAIAGFLVAFLKGESIEMCLKYACMCGAQNVQALDTVSGIKSWEETSREIKSEWPQNEIKIEESGWAYNHEQKIWQGPEDKNQLNR